MAARETLVPQHPLGRGWNHLVDEHLKALGVVADERRVVERRFVEGGLGRDEAPPRGCDQM